MSEVPLELKPEGPQQQEAPEGSLTSSSIPAISAAELKSLPATPATPPATNPAEDTVGGRRSALCASAARARTLAAGAGARACARATCCGALEPRCRVLFAAEDLHVVKTLVTEPSYK